MYKTQYKYMYIKKYIYKTCMYILCTFIYIYIHTIYMYILCTLIYIYIYTIYIIKYMCIYIY